MKTATERAREKGLKRHRQAPNINGRVFHTLTQTKQLKKIYKFVSNQDKQQQQLNEKKLKKKNSTTNIQYIKKKPKEEGK